MLTLPLLLHLASVVQSQEPPSRPEVNVVGLVRDICVTPEGTLWFVTDKGRAYRSRDHGSLWSEVLLPVVETDSLGLRADRPEHIEFFDEERGMISGSIGEEMHVVFVTEDGGDVWSRVSLGESLWVYGSWVGPGVNGWLVGSSGAVLHTPDAGKHWKVWSRPFNGASRSAAICALDAKHVVVASLQGELLMTDDAGAHWKPIPPPGGKVEELFFAGKGLVSAGPEGIRICDDLESGRWRDFQRDSKRCIGVGRHPDGLLLQLSTLEVELVSPGLELLRRWPSPLGAPATNLAGAQDFGVALFDVEGQYQVFDEQGVRSPRMQAASATQTWAMEDLDRAAAGPMFGISKSGVCESQDMGKSWRQVRDLESPSMIRALADGSGALVRGDGWWLWNSKAMQLNRIPILDAIDFTCVLIRREPLWLAVGWCATTEAARDSMRAFHSVAVGPGFESLIFGSPDGGRSWQEILRVRDCSVAASFFGSDGTLSLLLTNGEVHRARIGVEPADGARAARVVVRGSVAISAIKAMPEWNCWMEFAGDPAGHLGGDFYYGEPITHRTTDGGKTWTLLSSKPEGRLPKTRFVSLGNGQCLRLEMPYGEPSRLDSWEEGEFRVFRQFDSEVHEAHVDAGGSLLLRMKGGADWSLSSDGSAWSRLADILIPGE